MTTDLPATTLVEDIYLVLHYDGESGALLRRGKVNGSESQALAAAKLLDLLEAGTISIDPSRRGASVVASETSVTSPPLEQARAALAAQRKPRSATWCLANLGAGELVVERLVCSAFVVDERRPEAALTADGLAALRRVRGDLDGVLGDGIDPGASERIQLIAAILGAGDVWRNVWGGHARDDQNRIQAKLDRATQRVSVGGERMTILGALAAASAN